MHRMFRHFLLAAVLCSNAAMAEDAGQKAMFDARYAALRDALENRDVKLAATFFSPDFINIDAGDQKTDAKQLLDALSHAPKEDSKPATATTLKNIQVTGDSATIDQHNVVEGLRKEPSGDEKLEIITDSTDNWQKQNGQWVLTKTVTNEVEVKVNGISRMHKLRGK